MTKRITFLHAADLHLGASFRALRSLSRSWSERPVTAIPESYARLVDAAIAEQGKTIAKQIQTAVSSRALITEEQSLTFAVDDAGNPHRSFSFMTFLTQHRRSTPSGRCFPVFAARYAAG